MSREEGTGRADGITGGVLAGVAGGAAVIAALTVASRIAGFGRVVVFSRTVEDATAQEPGAG